MVDEAYYPIDETIYQVSRVFQQSIDAEQTRTSGEKRGMLLLGLLANGIAAHTSGDYYRLRLLLERVARTGQHERETFNALAERHAQTRVNLGIFVQVAEFFRDKVHEPHPWHADLISYADPRANRVRHAVDHGGHPRTPAGGHRNLCRGGAGEG